MKTATSAVPGATLYYEIRGAGPLLLVLQGGDGDAGRNADLVRRLADDYTVVTYDRRGLSRSRLDDPEAPVTLETHADDAHRLLAELTDRPALLFGSSFGALAGLMLARRHPEQVDTLVAHDPATARLLDDAGVARITGELADLDEIYRRDGVLAALKRLGEIVAADFTDREPDAGLPEPPDAQRLANLEFFFSRDVTAMVEAPFYPADATALKESPVRVVTAAGRASRRIWNYDCAQALAALLGTEIVEFPGGHTLSTHPKAFAARLHEVLTDRG
ncbi:alpha/beta hydrolase [Actinoallomurus spadix]|uniref:Alpha/beta hydrolase n=1 Tax=Actinoallomurus spadix TaxID=79912 RepID=A0ABP3HAG5_9ACTN|nr:alpha/beta hydrolase [Actinoallomurus spadix]MCO5987584.1 alpha/beta hydrolase [Actinoallomurus spadix]